MRVCAKAGRGIWWAAVVAALLCSAWGKASPAQKRRGDAGPQYDRSQRATLVHTAVVYVSGEDDAQHVGEVAPGNEVAIMDHNGEWVRVFANIQEPDVRGDGEQPEFTDDADKPQPVSGWIRDKGVVSAATPGGDAILFGAAANDEDEAEHPHAPKGAAEAAHLLYRRVFEYFPQSGLAAEAAYRSADIRWQLDRADISTLPSAKEQEAYLRPQLYEGDMQRVMKHYPGTKYAALAAYDLIDNKLCGDWQGLAKCPEQEAVLYEKYADRYPDSPKAPEALYNATYREAVLVEMYQAEDDRNRSKAAGQATVNLSKEMQDRWPNTDWTARAATLAYRVQQGIPVYGNDRE
jgi:outer membrane protein assembly factor BamD (BamD/ComL family)